MSEPWDRLVDETDDQYRAWLAYRDLPPVHRSIRNSTAAEMQLGTPYEPGTATARARREHGTKKRKREDWSSANHWVQRALQWDEHQALVRLSDRRDRVNEMIERHAELGQFLQSKGLEAVEAIELTGRTFLTQNVDRLVIQAIHDGARIERAAYGVEAFAGQDIDVNLSEDRTAGPRELMEQNPKVAAAAAMLLVAQAGAERAARKAAK